MKSKMKLQDIDINTEFINSLKTGLKDADSNSTAESSSLDDDDTTENYGQARIQAEIEKCSNDPSKKPDLSYIALIGLAIQHGKNHQMILADIYDWISQTFPYYNPNDRSWRNSVRHNLSLNECFIKSEKNKGGKGSHWAIHPANTQDFLQGDFRRRKARIHVRQWELQTRNETDACSGDTHSSNNGYVPMSTTTASADLLISLYGKEAIMGNEKKLELLKAGIDTSPQTPPENDLKPQVVSGLVEDQYNYHLSCMANHAVIGTPFQTGYQNNESVISNCSDSEIFTDDMALESGLKILSDALEFTSDITPEFLDLPESFRDGIGAVRDDMLALQPEVA